MTTTGLRLTLSAADRLPLDEPLVAIVRLVNQGTGPVTVSSRLNLAEDLSVTVTGPGRAPARAAWPWPVDSGLRQVRLAPGEVLEAGVLLLLADGAAPLFPVAGAYTLVAEFIPAPGDVVRGEPVTVVREEPLDSAARARMRALEDPQAAQSIASASVVGGAADALTGPIAETPTGRLLAALATGDTAAARDAAAALASEAGPAVAAATTAAVLPPGLYPGDERISAVGATLAGQDDDGRAAALLAERPWRPA
jgi:hypothetical protein